MRVLVTGGTGTIGTAVVAELLTGGHEVLALARSDASARSLTDAGAEVLRGSLADLDVLRAGAARVDGVITLAFGRDHGTPEGLERALHEETTALATLADALVGSDRPLVAASGTPWVPGRVATEADALPTDGPVGARARAVDALLEQAADGVRSSVVRIPRTAHHRGEGGFAGLLVDQARRSGVAGCPGDGTQRWPAVHALDAAVLFRLALESAPAGTTWHAVAEEGDAVADIAAVIGRRLGLPVTPVAEEDFGPFGPIFAMDQPASSARTRAALGWEPTHPGLLADLENLVPSGATLSTVTEIDAHEARRRIDAGEAVLVDVREPHEWEAGHAPGALHRPLASLDPSEFTGRTVVTTCRGGGRGGRAADQLAGADVEAVNLAGGLGAWSESGGALVRDDGAPGSLASP